MKCQNCQSPHVIEIKSATVKSFRCQSCGHIQSMFDDGSVFVSSTPVRSANAPQWPTIEPAKELAMNLGTFLDSQDDGYYTGHQVTDNVREWLKARFKDNE